MDLELKINKRVVKGINIGGFYICLDIVKNNEFVFNLYNDYVNLVENEHEALKQVFFKIRLEQAVAKCEFYRYKKALSNFNENKIVKEGSFNYYFGLSSTLNIKDVMLEFCKDRKKYHKRLKFASKYLLIKIREAEPEFFNI